MGRVLVVDDEADIRELVRDILSEEGYAVETAANAAEARAACARQAPDLVLLDIWMAETDGISLLREWQQAQSMAAPVVMMSGHGTVETAIEATRLGAIDYVEKPLSLAKLLRTVQRALEEGKRRQRATRTLVPPLIAPVGRSRLMRDLRDKVKQIVEVKNGIESEQAKKIVKLIKDNKLKVQASIQGTAVRVSGGALRTVAAAARALRPISSIWASRGERPVSMGVI